MNRQQKIFSVAIKTLIYACAILVFSILLAIIGYVIMRGLPHLSADLFDWTYTTSNHSMLPSIINTLQMILITLLISVPIGVFAAIYMVEYAQAGNKFIKVVRLATETLQGIPSIVYGLFGYIFFNLTLGLGYSLISGALTMAIMVLPLIIRATEEALIAVDNSYREASYGLGARKLRTVFNVVLPSAMNGIFSGVILAIGRVFGETAALLFTSGSVSALTGPTGSGSTLAVHMYKLFGEGRQINESFATALVLLVFVVIINTVSTILGNKLGGKQ
ncbi:MAG: phosphate ABC transporter permease PstA [Tissierellia bacterium]|nr:phosphate ABC transporter permease PstA [Tissierellia bacterium]